MGTRIPTHNRECDHCHRAACHSGRNLCDAALRDMGFDQDPMRWSGEWDRLIVWGAVILALGIAIGMAVAR